MVVAQLAYDLHRQSGGRFHLGLGTQVKGHNERRFSVPWSAPAPRMREYVESLRAIWRCWEKERAAALRGQALSLHADDARVRAAAHGPPAHPGEHRRRRARDAQARRSPLRRRAAPRLRDAQVPARRSACRSSRRGLARSGRPRAHFDVWGGGFIVTGADEAEVRGAARGDPLPGGLLRLHPELPRCLRRARLGGAGDEAPRDVEARPLERDGGAGSRRSGADLRRGRNLRRARLRRRGALRRPRATA